MIGAEKISGLATPMTPLSAQTGPTLKKDADKHTTEMAGEFEGTFLSMLLKEMRQTLEPDGGLFPGDTGDVQGGLFDLLLGTHLAQGGGVGVAAALVRQIQTNPVKSTDAANPRTGNGVPATPRS